MLFDEMYDPGVLEKRKKLLRQFWNGRIPTVWSAYSDEFSYRQMKNTDEMSHNACLNLNAGAKLPGINIPRLTVDFGTVSTASYWGGEVRRSSSGNPWIDTVIHEPKDVMKLSHKDPCEGDVERCMDLWLKVSGMLGTENLPCSTFDLQGPLNTLALMWDQTDMMITMYDEPDTVHKALDKVTDVIIANIRCMLDKIPNIETPLWPFIWLPPDIGIGITEDYMPLLSPELYKEFGIPYVEGLSEEFGGLFIHCCGQFSQHIDNLVSSGINILGMEFVHPNIDIEKLFKSFGSKAVFVPNIMDNHIEDFGSYTDYLRAVEKLRRKDTRIWYLLRADLPDFTEQVSFAESLTDEV